MGDRSSLFMVFDVESVGLQGEGYAVGYVVVDGATGREWTRGLFACPPDAAAGSDAGRAWIAENIPPLAANCETPEQVRDEFWRVWREWGVHQKALLAADVPWPVEARFLNACVDDRPDTREWHGPYPLLDVNSVLYAAGLDPINTEFPRRENELPKHDPLADARQSARLLVETLKKGQQ